MKVLFITFDYVPYPIFGMGVHVRDLRDEFKSLNVDCRIATINRYGLMRKSADALWAPCHKVAANLKIMNCSCLVEDDHCFKRLPGLVSDFSAKRGWRPDLIHLHGWPMARCARELAERLEVPLLSTLHFLDIQYEKMKNGHPLGKAQKAEVLRREREMVAWSDHLISISGFGKVLLKAAYPAHVRKTEVIMHGIAVDKVPAGFWARRNKVPVVTFVGRLVEDEKGVEEFCAAVLPLRAANKVRVNILGAGVLLPGLKRKYGKVFNITGQLPHDGVKKYLLRSDFMVVPSLAEHFGLVVLEGMAYGAVPIVTRSGAFPEIVREAENGFLFELDRHGARPAINVATLREKIVQALAFPKAALEDIRKRNRRAIENEYSLRRMAADTLKYYRKIIATR